MSETNSTNFNPYAAPETDLESDSNLSQQKDLLAQRNRRLGYLFTFLICAFVPVFLGPLLAALTRFVPGNDIALALLIGVAIGWIFTIPFALLMMLVIFVLRKLSFEFKPRDKLVLLPIVFTGVWYIVVALGHMALGAFPDQEKEFVQFFIIYGVPAFVCGILTALVIKK